MRPIIKKDTFDYELGAMLGDDLVWRWVDGVPNRLDDEPIPGPIVAACRLWGSPGDVLHVECVVAVCVEYDLRTPEAYDEIEIECVSMRADIEGEPMRDRLLSDMDGGRAWVNWQADMFEYLRDLFIQDDALDRIGG